MVEKDEVVYAVGPEVEHTPVFSAKTLFVNGIRKVEQMTEFATLNGCKHISLGAFDSFQKNKKWNDIISALLASGLHVSLHYPAETHEYLLQTLDNAIWGHPYFIPIVVITLPRIRDLNKNFMFKFSDEVGGTNLGVWCSPAREVLDSNRFTPWDDYNNIVTFLTNAGLKKLQAK